MAQWSRRLLRGDNNLGHSERRRPSRRADGRLHLLRHQIPAAGHHQISPGHGTASLRKRSTRDCYRSSVLSKIGAQVSPLTPGKWLIGVSLPLTGAWIAAAALSKTDLFTGPFFWMLAYMLVVGIGLVVWGAVTTPINPPKSKASQIDLCRGARGNRLGCRFVPRVLGACRHLSRSPSKRGRDTALPCGAVVSRAGHSSTLATALLTFPVR